MKSIGLMATTVAAVVAAAVAALGVRSIPDIKRYLRMRNM